MRILILLTVSALLASLVSAAEQRVSSPNGRLGIVLTDDGLRYRIELDSKPLLADSALGDRREHSNRCNQGRRDR